MRLILAVPDLLTLEREALVSAPSLGTLARYAAAPTVAPGGLSAALFSVAGLPADAAAAPVAAVGAGLVPGPSYVFHADPVSLVAGRDNVILAGRVDDLSPVDAAPLVAALNDHFAGDGLVFHAPRPDAWFLTLASAPALTTTSLARVTGALYAHLPMGAAATVWRRWLSEMQMLLHAHPVNAAREAAGLAQVTGIWLSEGGTLPPSSLGVATQVGTANRNDAALQILAPVNRSGDVARGIAELAGRKFAPTPAGFTLDLLRQDTIAVLPAAHDAASIGAVEIAWIAPALSALEHGKLHELTLIGDGAGHVATWQALRPSFIARLRARIDPRAFTVPMPERDV